MNTDFQFDDAATPRPVVPVSERRVVYSERRTFLSSFGSALGQLMGLFVGVIVIGVVILGACLLYLRYSVSP